MSKILKTIEITDDAVLDTSKEGKKTILKVIDKSENKEDRMKTADDVKVFPEPSDPVLNEASNTILDQNIKDYEVRDLTKSELQGEEEVKEVLDDIDIFKIINSADGDLTETYGDYGDINILFSRSSKDTIRESALIEFSTNKKNSYVLGLNILKLVEDETLTEEETPIPITKDNNFKFIVKSSYGKVIYEQECLPSRVNNAVTRFLEAIYLRDQFSNVLKESVDSDRWGEIISDVNKYTKDTYGDRDVISFSYSTDESKPLEVLINKGKDDDSFKSVRKYIEDKYGDELAIEDVSDSSFLLK